MRTEQQIKRKLNELLVQKQAVEARLAGGSSERDERELARLEESIQLLGWVLNEPTGSYHM
ncbi:hypothetical protein J31TS4_21340 [Paenibacillus sp. J31TS4]|uniref:hypothetical protein n=1 Tax=Paenibacillus sp. J31TS4 TaxID=2807195 RepID=UPI001B25CF93|nr:hypothetical protein [Paenibacillus sp. J31TS4]GIP38854.1 hypothetical protein J31TS4_21340 [Paenibacillus sp. J31TS4]